MTSHPLGQVFEAMMEKRQDQNNKNTQNKAVITIISQLFLQYVAFVSSFYPNATIKTGKLVL
jgi:hypothetical protein